MSESRSRDNWNHTSSLLAMLFNVNRDPRKQQAVSPELFNPFERKGERRKDTKLAFKCMEQIFIKHKEL
jgi:hypothetical protein